MPFFIIQKLLYLKVCKGFKNADNNKNYEYYGIVSGLYPYVFTVLIDGTQKSFNYSDVIIGDVVVNFA